MHNDRGRRIREQLQRVRELSGGESAEPHVARWYAQGETLVTKMSEVVHRQRDPWSIDDDEVRAWRAEGGRLLRGD